MRKLLILFTIVITISGCGAKEAQSPDFLYGSKLYNNFVQFYLKGKTRLADMAFANSENQFLKMDAMCNLSRIYIGRLVLEEEGMDDAVLSRAIEYAKIGKCESESVVISFLQGEEYDKKVLLEPYSLIAGAKADELVNVAGDDKLPGYTRTRLLRKAALQYISSDPSKAEITAEAALVIDRFHGWSLNILRDLTIIKVAREKSGKDFKDINKRIELVKTVLSKK